MANQLKNLRLKNLVRESEVFLVLNHLDHREILKDFATRCADFIRKEDHRNLGQMEPIDVILI